MDDKSKEVLQEENHAVSSESKSPESVEQEGIIQKSIDVGTCKMGAAQDSSKPLMKDPLHRPVSIDNIATLDGGSTIITLRIRNFFTGKIRYVGVSYESLSPSTLKKCVTENGGESADWKRLHSLLMHDIKMCVENNLIEIIQGHTKLGWCMRSDGLVFYHQHMISSSPDNQSSEYAGTMDIKPKGSLDNIVNMMRQWILSTPEWSPLEAIIAFSVASVVIPFSKIVWQKNLNNLIIHLHGNSTTGKSTSLRLHAGLAGNPFGEKNGLWLNHQSSLAAIVRRIGDNQGLPVSIDELSSAGKREYTEFIYALGNGEEKDRLKAGGNGFSASANFCTIFVSSGEISLLKKCSGAIGTKTRCVELCNVKWTDSKEQADAIYECLQMNYGWVAPMVAQELLNNSDKWRAKWDQLYIRVKRQMDKEMIRLAIGPRISEFVVLFTLAAEIANKTLGINLNINEIYKFCYLHIITVNADEANLADRAYEYLLRYAIKNPDEFISEVECETFIGSYYSKKKIKGFFRSAKKPRTINGKEYRRQLVFFKDDYEKILGERAFSPTVVSHELRDAHFLLVKDKKRYTYPLVFNEIKHNCYVLFCNNEDEMMYDAMDEGRYRPDSDEDYDL